LLSAVSRLLGREFDPATQRHNGSAAPGRAKAVPHAEQVKPR